MEDSRLAPRPLYGGRRAAPWAGRGAGLRAVHPHTPSQLTRRSEPQGVRVPLLPAVTSGHGLPDMAQRHLGAEPASRSPGGPKAGGRRCSRDRQLLRCLSRHRRTHVCTAFLCFPRTAVPRRPSVWGVLTRRGALALGGHVSARVPNTRRRRFCRLAGSQLESGVTRRVRKSLCLWKNIW